jgi:hypothetical protein
MMLPILISVSVTPVSYFFCAATGEPAHATINPDSKNDLTSVLKGVLKKSSSASCMSFLLRQDVRFFGQFPLRFSRVTARRIAAARVCRKRLPPGGRFVA